MKTPLILKLDFDEEDDFYAGVDAISLVENPAIEIDFFTFSDTNRFEFKSYDDYPKAVSQQAQVGINLNEKVNNKCATRVGKIRARQLADGKPITEETIKRMFAYLSRAKEYYNPDDREACGTISYLLWGGEPALKWSEKKLAQIEREREMSAETELIDSSMEFSSFLETLESTTINNPEDVIKFFEAIDDSGCDCGGGCGCKNTLDTHVESFCDVSGDCNEVGDYTTNFTAINEEQMIVSPVMIPNKPIIRKDDNGDDFYVYFTPDTIERMAHNFLKKKFIDNMNIEHSSFMKLGGINVVESWLKKSNEDKSSKYGYGELPEGTWFVQMKVEDDNLWQLIKSGAVKGLSLEGSFNMEKIKSKQYS